MLRKIKIIKSGNKITQEEVAVTNFTNIQTFSSK